MSAELANQVVRKLVDAGYVAYWAGGCVRDTLRGVVPNDYDVATNATPEQVRNVFGRRRSIPVGESFGVILVLGQKNSDDKIEVATFRREGEYVDGRRPSQVEFCHPEEDASRRDFTINGMFYDPLTNQVLDFVGGQQDLQNKIIRAIGDPHKRMSEDKLRMLRAVRFCAALEFTLDEETAQAIKKMVDEVRVVSAERITQEFRKMLIDLHRARALQLAEELGLIRAILPEVQKRSIETASSNHWTQMLAWQNALQTTTFEVSFAALLNDVPENNVPEICRRWKLSNNETKLISWLSSNRGKLETLPDSQIAETKRLAAHPHFCDLLQLERTHAQVLNQSLAPYDWVVEFLQKTPASEIQPQPFLSGADLLKAGLPAGPKFRDWLTAVYDAQLNGEVTTRQAALDLVLSWANSEESETPPPGREDQ